MYDSHTYPKSCITYALKNTKHCLITAIQHGLWATVETNDPKVWNSRTFSFAPPLELIVITQRRGNTDFHYFPHQIALYLFCIASWIFIRQHCNTPPSDTFQFLEWTDEKCCCCLMNIHEYPNGCSIYQFLSGINFIEPLGRKFCFNNTELGRFHIPVYMPSKNCHCVHYISFDIN